MDEVAKFYYGREPITNCPKVTVCLIKCAQNMFARGMSICSDSEKSLDRNKGRNMALGRARKAVANGASDLPILRKEAWQVLSRCGMLRMERKSEWNAVVTSFERRLFDDEARQ